MTAAEDRSVLVKIDLPQGQLKQAEAARFDRPAVAGEYFARWHVLEKAGSQGKKRKE
ncbi:hypothetical protein [Denitrobaculum tricleocarpae]|uniref:hypothetical protein n=1 Tax=Denitrobaculum tricleocarpae TaxID=2591009 RepID=UPI0015D28E7F|nr:hypothetical protein [Denitrobaculum tricleocarpae]